MSKLLDYTGLQHYHEKVQEEISQLGLEVGEVTYKEVLATPTWVDNSYVKKADGSIASSSTNEVAVISLGNAKNVRFLGLITVTDSYASGYAFYNGDTVIATSGWDYGAPAIAAKEYFIPVPIGATTLKITSWKTRSDSVPVLTGDFYCYLRTGESVIEEIDSLSLDVTGNRYKATPGFYVDKNDNKIPSSTSIISDYIPCTGAPTIEWYHGYNPANTNCCISAYNSSKEKVSYWTANTIYVRKITSTNANIAYLRASFSTSADRVYVKVNGVMMWEWQKNLHGLKDEVDQIYIEDINLAGITLKDGKLSSEGVWVNTARYKHIIIPCVEGDKFLVRGGQSSNYAFIEWYPAAYTGDYAVLTPGTSVTAINNGAEIEITIPEKCIYLYFEAGDSSVTNGNRAQLPDSIKKVINIHGDISTLQEDVQNVAVGAKISFIGAGDSYYYSWTKYISGIVPDNSYRVFFTKKPTVHSGSRNYPRTRIYSYDAQNNSTQLVSINQSESLPDYIDIVAPSDSVAIRIGGRCALGDIQEMIVVPLLGSASSSGDILDLNPDSEFIPKMQSAAKRYWTGTSTNLPTPLVIAHLSDIHGNWTNVERFIKFVNHHNAKIDLMLNTGDTVQHQYSQGIDGYAAITGAEDILNVVGNHDTLIDTEQTTSWTEHVGVDAYNMLIKPFVSNWGVTQPSNAEANGYCYYYKDFAAKSLRLIVLDMMGYDDTQDTWLTSILASALSSEYHVVICSHFCPARTYSDRNLGVFSVLDCNYSTLYESGTSSSQLSDYNQSCYKVGDTVASFITSGGHFVGYVSGHYHKDFVAKHDVHPEQMIYAIGSSKSGEVSDYMHTVGTRSQDEFQIVAIDTKNTIVKLFKVGANYDRYGRSKSSVCVDYTQCKVIGEGF